MRAELRRICVSEYFRMGTLALLALVAIETILGSHKQMPHPEDQILFRESVVGPTTHSGLDVKFGFEILHGARYDNNRDMILSVV